MFTWIAATDDRSRVVLVAVSLHIPDHLVAEELGDLGGLKDEPLDVACKNDLELDAVITLIFHSFN